MGFIPELCLWYAAIVALDLKVIWLLADDGGTVSYPRVLGTGPAAEAMRRDLKRGAPTPQR